MKHTTIIAGLAAGLFAAFPTFAGPWDGHPDMEYSILNDLDKPAYVGTSLSDFRPRIDPYHGTVSGIADFDTTGFIVGNATPEGGLGDISSHVVMQVGR